MSNFSGRVITMLRSGRNVHEIAAELDVDAATVVGHLKDPELPNPAGQSGGGGGGGGVVARVDLPGRVEVPWATNANNVMLPFGDTAFRIDAPTLHILIAWGWCDTEGLDGSGPMSGPQLDVQFATQDGSPLNLASMSGDYPIGGTTYQSDMTGLLVKQVFTPDVIFPGDYTMTFSGMKQGTVGFDQADVGHAFVYDAHAVLYALA